MIRHRQRPKEARRQREYSVFVAVWLCSWCEGIDNEDGGMKYGWLCGRSYGEVEGQVIGASRFGELRCGREWTKMR